MTKENVHLRQTLAGYSFYFEVDGLSEFEFSEVGGLNEETEVISHVQSTKGGKQYVLKSAGNPKWGDITVKRASLDDKLAQWRKQVIDGKIKDARKNGSIVVYDTEDAEVMRWNIKNAWPSKLSYSNLTAKGSEMLMEECTITHEGIERVK